MFERFTDRARRAVVLAQESAKVLKKRYIGTEHILLGILYEGEGVAATALREMNVSYEDAKSQIWSGIGPEDVQPTGHMSFTPNAKELIDLALREALSLGHNHIGTEHLLLAILRKQDCTAAEVIRDLNVETGLIRTKLLQTIQRIATRAEEFSREDSSSVEQIPDETVEVDLHISQDEETGETVIRLPKGLDLQGIGVLALDDSGQTKKLGWFA